MLELKAAVLGGRRLRRDPARDVSAAGPVHAHRRPGACCSAPTSRPRWPRSSGWRVDVGGHQLLDRPRPDARRVRTCAQNVGHVPLVHAERRAARERRRAGRLPAVARTRWPRCWPSSSSDFGVNLVGGCCGTTPGAHPRGGRADPRARRPRAARRPRPLPELSSAMKAVAARPGAAPAASCERLNTQGSRKVKELLLADDYDGLLADRPRPGRGRRARARRVHGADRARGRGGADAHAGRGCSPRASTRRCDRLDRGRRARERAARSTRGAASSTRSTSRTAASGSAGAAAGEALRRRGDRLTIDEKGMAKTAERKVEVARRTVTVAREYGLEPDRLIFDALTFTLATGDAEYRHSAVETLEGIRRIKAEIPGVLTTLGVSNVSFGLAKAAREVLNSVFLYHAVQAGLDLAIVNPKDITPYPPIDAEERELAEDLILDRREDALARLIAHFEGQGPAGGGHRRGARRGAAGRAAHPPADPAPPAGGDRGARRRGADPPRAGDGAERRAAPGHEGRGRQVRLGRADPALRAAVGRGDEEGGGATSRSTSSGTRASTKGTVVLATVYGDVHDIGKNLVKTILVEQRLHRARPGQAGAGGHHPREGGGDRRRRHRPVGPAGLDLASRCPPAWRSCTAPGLSFPVLIGGAAINRDFGRRANLLGDGAPTSGASTTARTPSRGWSWCSALMDPARREALRRKTVEKALQARNAPVAEAAPGRVGPAQRRPPGARSPRSRRSGARGWSPPARSRFADLWPHLDLKSSSSCSGACAAGARSTSG